ncbi:DUF397 domain-containing protein [Streptomyces sp. NPDC091259]|uniref:DUF397 domain-containing protein n=1 Tax=Streptomyces sp. NPDC091259 TaxID=3365976 RepID=UPI003806D069
MTTTGTNATDVAPEAAWFKSSYSGAEGNACVEAVILQSAVGVRDSKDEKGPALIFQSSTWTTFVSSVR